ncbi:MAG: HAD family phosphatase [Actinobacteria bacterium]|nr:HAD family phosphatase [Actinomycetota bacterium]
MTKAFLFDYDGVYTSGANNDWVYSRLAENLGISFEQSAAWLEEIWAPFLKGTMLEDEVWDYLESKYGQAITEDKRDIWFTWEELKPHPGMVKIVKKLKDSGFVVGVLSNIFANNRATIETNGGYDGFDLVVASCDLGYKKPQPEIFEYALSQLSNIQPNEIIFLDDREANAKAAEAHGMKGVYVQNHNATIADIKSIAKLS